MITRATPSSSSQTGTASASGRIARTAAAQRGRVSSKSHAISKSAGSPRVKIESSDRMDNCFDKLLKAIGHIRTKHQARTVKFKVNQLVHDLGKLHFGNLLSGFMLAFCVVLNELKDLNTQANLNRALYTAEFKSSLKTLCSDQGISILKAAAESAGLFIKPDTMPIRSLEEAEEEVKSLKRALKKKDEQLEALKKENSFVNLANLAPPQLGDLVLDEDASFTTEDTGMVSLLELPVPLPLPVPPPSPSVLDLEPPYSLDFVFALMA